MSAAYRGEHAGPAAAVPRPGAAETRAFFPLLDAMRWVAAMAVVVFHTPDLVGFQLPKGYLAVDLFFVLSGVVIANAYETRLLGAMTLRRFAYVRLVRLYPLYLLGLVLGIAAALLVPNPHLDGMGLPLGIAAGLLMIPRFWSVATAGDPNLLLFPLNGPAWSLFFELAINLGYALVVRHLTTTRLLGIILLSGAAVAASGLLMHSLDLGWRPRQIPFGVVRTSYAFFAGVLIARTAAWTGRLTARLPRWPTAAAILLLIAAALSIPCGSSRDALYDGACALFLFPVLVCCALPLSFPRRPTNLFALGGTTSYAIYILHAPCSELARALFAGASPLVAVPWRGVAFMLVVLVFAALADRVYDKPVRKRLGGLQRHRPET